MSDPGLTWGIKRRFIAYLGSLPDGAFSVDEGASRVEGDVFRFPAVPDGDGEIEGARFTGVLRLMGHGGMMHVKIAHPAVERRDGELVLTIADPDDEDPAIRIPFARLTPPEPSVEDDLTTWYEVGADLTAEATELFAGRYPAGDALDPIRIRLLTSPRPGPRAAAPGPRSKGR